MFFAPFYFIEWAYQKNYSIVSFPLEEKTPIIFPFHLEMFWNYKLKEEESIENESFILFLDLNKIHHLFAFISFNYTTILHRIYGGIIIRSTCNPQSEVKKSASNCVFLYWTFNWDYFDSLSRDPYWEHLKLQILTQNTH